jgi:hypothetical protein
MAQEEESSNVPKVPLIWCNTHQREAYRCKVEGGILLPCRTVDLTNIVILDK